MLHRFATYEEAAMFVAMKRDLGYHADILHEHVGVLWGPLATGGVAAWVSEEAADDGDEVPDAGIQVPLWREGISRASVYVVLGVVVIYALSMLMQHSDGVSFYVSHHGMDLLGMLGGFALYGLALVVTASLLSGWCHWIWSPQQRGHLLAKGVFLMVAILLLLLATPLLQVIASLIFAVLNLFG